MPFTGKDRQQGSAPRKGPYLVGVLAADEERERGGGEREERKGEGREGEREEEKMAEKGRKRRETKGRDKERKRRDGEEKGKIEKKKRDGWKREDGVNETGKRGEGKGRER